MSEKQFWVHQSGHGCSLLFGDPDGDAFGETKSRVLGEFPQGGWVVEPNCSGPVSSRVYAIAQELNGPKVQTQMRKS